MPRELVVLLDGAGQPAGTTAKDTVHTDNTPLHLAFSCWLFDATGALLITRRALAKKAWPGVWTNSFCGHPGPGEPSPAEVDSWEWVDPARVITAAQAAPFAFSPWLVEELADPRLRAALGAS